MANLYSEFLQEMALPTSELKMKIQNKAIGSSTDRYPILLKYEYTYTLYFGRTAIYLCINFPALHKPIVIIRL